MGGNVAAGLLLAVCAFMLAFGPRRVAVAGLLASVLLGLVAIGLGLLLPIKVAFAGCWISLIVIAMLVYFPAGLKPWPWLAVVLAADAGFWAGQVIIAQGAFGDAAQVLPVLLLIVPAGWCVERGWALAVRIVTSWLLAVALLVGAIPYLVIHPGYQPDHME